MTDKQPAHVEQALAELDGTENEEQRVAARKRLEAAGHRAAAAKTEADPGEARQSPPKGRQAQQRNTT